MNIVSRLIADVVTGKLDVRDVAPILPDVGCDEDLDESRGSKLRPESSRAGRGSLKLVSWRVAVPADLLVIGGHEHDRLGAMSCR